MRHARHLVCALRQAEEPLTLMLSQAHSMPEEEYRKLFIELAIELYGDHGMHDMVNGDVSRCRGE
jgi:hypothetical protein